MVTTTKTAERVTTVKTGVGTRSNGFGNGRSKLPPTGPPGGGGGGGHDHDEDDGALRHDPSSVYRVAIWMTLAAVFMLFLSLAVTYVFLSTQREWKPLVVPRVLWFSTSLILLSSLTMEAARNAIRKGKESAHLRWLFVSLLLGFAFIAAQLAAWWRLVRAGVYMADNPHSSLFYILTGAHAVHLVGGIIALAALLFGALVRQRNFDELRRRHPATNAVALYWHFMDGLWLCLFALLLIR